MIFLFTTVQIISFVLYFSGFYPQLNLPNILASAINTTLILIYFLQDTSALNKIDKSALLLGLSFVCWFVAEFLYGYYDGILGIDAYPSVPDVFYLLGYLFLFLFLGFINKLYKIELGFIISTLVTFKNSSQMSPNHWRGQIPLILIPQNLNAVRFILRFSFFYMLIIAVFFYRIFYLGYKCNSKKQISHIIQYI